MISHISPDVLRANLALVMGEDILFNLNDEALELFFGHVELGARSINAFDDFVSIIRNPPPVRLDYRDSQLVLMALLRREPPPARPAMAAPSDGLSTVAQARVDHAIVCPFA